MQFAVNLPNFAEYADPAVIVEMAVSAERSGWDGLFIWDHIVIADGLPVADPWTVLAAVAQATKRLFIGTMVTPLPRRHPWVLARQVTTLDRLSGGRVILGVGIGHPPDREYGTFGEPTDERTRADMLDEGLEVLKGMWSGKPFEFTGRHYRVRRTRFAPVPHRIPIWVAGTWPNHRPFRRAARHDGMFPITTDLAPLSPEEVADCVEYVRRHRTTMDGYDITVSGPPRADDVVAYAGVGVTWYQVGPGFGETVDSTREWIGAGPPR
jgi:alkanesulfonate monooxygenase SsuD/methylene tetrahydromethanopterin reductase-like flavin-dependent oxidoreductase (luciferase family)